MEENIEIVPLEYCGQKVLTTNQIAVICECFVHRIQDAFYNHREEFILGVDYFKLTGEELRNFKVENKALNLRDKVENKALNSGDKNFLRDKAENKALNLGDKNLISRKKIYLYTESGNPMNPNVIYAKNILLLFTESGAMKMAKVTKTDKAKLIFAAFRYGLFQTEKKSVTRNNVPLVMDDKKLEMLNRYIELTTDDNLRNKLIRKATILLFGEEI